MGSLSGLLNCPKCNTFARGFSEAELAANAAETKQFCSATIRMTG